MYCNKYYCFKNFLDYLNFIVHISEILGNSFRFLNFLIEQKTFLD